MKRGEDERVASYDNVPRNELASQNDILKEGQKSGEECLKVGRLSKHVVLEPRLFSFAPPPGEGDKSYKAVLLKRQNRTRMCPQDKIGRCHDGSKKSRGRKINAIGIKVALNGTKA